MHTRPPVNLNLMRQRGTDASRRPRRGAVLQDATARPATPNRWRAGELQGRISLSEPVQHLCSEEAARYYRDAEAEDFVGDDVETSLVYPWLPPLDTWFPTAAVERLGLAAHVASSGNLVVLTMGVDLHVDAAYGPIFAWVLHNDALRFRQGRVAQRFSAGDWFVFDDRRPHAVDSAPGASIFMAWVVPLLPAQGGCAA